VHLNIASHSVVIGTPDKASKMNKLIDGQFHVLPSL
jgi:hypothetical protein